jgi:hypothetical protein
MLGRLGLHSRTAHVRTFLAELGLGIALCGHVGFLVLSNQSQNPERTRLAVQKLRHSRVCNYPSTVQLSRTSLFIGFTCVHHCSPYDFGMTDSGVIKACQQHKMLKTLGSPHANSNVHSRLVATSLSGKATTVPHPRQSRQAKANAICMR